MLDFTFTVEPVAAVEQEIQPLLQEHWALISSEYSRSTLRPNVDMYRQFDDAGALRLFCVRANGYLVGYATVFIAPHPHRADELAGTMDTFYVQRDFRSGGTAAAFLGYIEKVLRTAHVATVGLAVRDPLVARWFRVAGQFKPVETIMERSL
jgi:GNAT superfamily N-acetyltransferase